MDDLRAFYLALPDEDKQGFLLMLHAALEHPVNRFSVMASLQSGMALCTDIQEEIRRNGSQALEDLAGYPMSLLYSYLKRAGLVVLPSVLPIEGASAQLSNSEQGNSEGGSALSLPDSLSIHKQENHTISRRC